MKTVVIITGASRGLGAALARATAGVGVEQLLLSRHAADIAPVGAECVRRGAIVHTLGVDLADATAEARVEAAAQGLDWSGVDRATLFNNASQIGPIRLLREIHAVDVQRLVAVNFGAAIWVTSLFLRACWAQRVAGVDIVNISSGVSLKPLAGWSLYCCSKAGLNLLTASIVEETAHWPSPVRAVALNPGPLDTEMQREIRQSAPDQFPERARFVALFEEGRLTSPDEGARKVLALLAQSPFPQGRFVDLRQL
jgi:benzil reductase ((S)-benzoin forming)